MYRLLIVEDDLAMRFIYDKMTVWEECGYTIAGRAANGKEALEMLEKESYDLIFSDVRMPFMDGIEFLRRLRETGNRTNIIFASSYDEFEYARQGLILGAFDYLLKPIDEKKLADVLERVKSKIKSNPPEEHFEPAVEEILSELGVSARDGKFIHNMASYFSANYGKNVTIEEAAEKFKYSRDYFGKTFKQHLGVSFHRFSAMIRIAYAKDLIRKGGYKTSQISDMLGFSSSDYFLKVFKEVTGMTPAAFKSQCENE